MRSTPSRRSFPNVDFETVPNVRLIDYGLFPRPLNVRSSTAAFSYTSLLQAIDGVMSMVFHGFLPTFIFSSSSTLQIFREASHL